MINQSTIARPYARAIFAVALKTNHCNEWLEYLSLLAIITSDQKISLLLKNPTVSIDKKILLLTNCCLKFTENIFITFLRVLVRKNRLLYLPTIYRLFKSYVYEKENTLDITVTTAFLLKENEQKNLLYVLSEKFNKKVFINFFINPFLIGGILVKVGNKVLNNTIRESLISFQNHLLKS